jgi:decaprenyl-phosphate phosphoribosyltransferase
MKSIHPFITAARPHQWLKNLLVFSAPLAAGSIHNREILFRTTYVAFLFLIISVSIYLFNDVRDIEVDRNHPIKSQRPIANGDLSQRSAMIMAPLLTLGSLSVGFTISTSLGISLAVYVFINILYSIKGKSIPYLELLLISSGFVIRAISGGIVSGISLSFWFISVVSCTSFFMATGKRYAELSQYEINRTRPVLSRYTLKRLGALRIISTTLAATTYGFWLSQTSATHGMFSILSLMIFTVTISRYNFRVQQGYGEDPIRTLTGDFWLLSLLTLWATTYCLAIYG